MSSEIKPISPAIAANLLPPNMNHDYFKCAAKHPFRHNENSFSLINAWWLAEAPLLAYADERFAKEKFAAACLMAKFF